MKTGKIVRAITLVGIAVLLFGCGASFGINGGILGYWDNAVVSTKVTTTPIRAKLNLLQVNKKINAERNTTFSPAAVRYAPDSASVYGTYLTVSHSGYKTQRMRLDPDEEEIHIDLKPDLEDKSQNYEFLALGRALGDIENSPDLSYIIDEASIPELINEVLAQDLTSPLDSEYPKKFIQRHELASVFSNDLDYHYSLNTQAGTGNIHVVSSPSGAELFLDEIPIGTTPIEISVQSGLHRIVLRKKGYEFLKTQFTIHDKQKKVIEVDMVPYSTEVAHSEISEIEQ